MSSPLCLMSVFVFYSSGMTLLISSELSDCASSSSCVTSVLSLWVNLCCCEWVAVNFVCASCAEASASCRLRFSYIFLRDCSLFLED